MCDSSYADHEHECHHLHLLFARRCTQLTPASADGQLYEQQRLSQKDDQVNFFSASRRRTLVAPAVHFRVLGDAAAPPPLTLSSFKSRCAARAARMSAWQSGGAVRAPAINCAVAAWPLVLGADGEDARRLVEGDALRRQLASSVRGRITRRLRWRRG